jgi:putative membrane protein
MAEQTTLNAPALDASTRLALERTRASYERTMMSWIRTSTSLITFGFTIYKFFQLEGLRSRENQLIGPRGFSLILVSIGLGMLVLATIEHRQNIRRLDAEYPRHPRSLAAILAATIAILGILAFAAMIARA